LYTSISHCERKKRKLVAAALSRAYASAANIQLMA
jgi:hypothetical protein